MSLNPTIEPKESEQFIFEDLSTTLCPSLRRELAALSRIERIPPAGCTGDTLEEIASALVLELSKESPGVRVTATQKGVKELPDVRVEQDKPADGKPSQI
jgi:hypothetical protein